MKSFQNQGKMKKCVVCGKETKRKHILMNLVSIYDPEGQKIVWQRVWSEHELPLCESCVDSMGKKIVEFHQKVQRAFESLEAQEEQAESRKN